MNLLADNRWRYWWSRARLLWMSWTDREVAGAWASPADLRWIAQGDSALALLQRACQRLSHRPCLGTLRYSELWGQVLRWASWLHQQGVGPEQRVGLCGHPSPSWVAADLACLYLGAVSVPLSVHLTTEEWLHIQQQTGMAWCCCEPGLGPAPGQGLLLLPLTPLPQQPAPPPPATVGGDCLYSLVYTSGSTGMPKGVMLTRQRWYETLRDTFQTVRRPRLTLGYLPLNHMAGRINLYKLLVAGGITHFVTNPDLSTLWEDLQRVRPTDLLLVPRVSAMLYQRFQEMQATPQAARTLRAQILGGRLCFTHIGAAPTAPEIQDFLGKVLHLHVTDLYGSTELGPISVNGKIHAWLRYKLVDHPELGFTRQDKPHPRGELAVLSPRQTPGYFNDPASSQRLRDSEGYVLTGDIVEEVAPGHIRWLDRCHNVTRLAQGEFLQLSRLEEVFCSSPLIEQAFLYANPLQSFGLAIFVSKAQPQEIRRELQRLARQHGLAAYEIPRDFLLEDQPFSAENGLLSDAKKLRRPQLKERYGPRLEELYQVLHQRQLHSSGGSDFLTTVAQCLGLERVEPGDCFVTLGGDSLTASQLSWMLERHHGLRVPASDLLDPQRTLQSLQHQTPNWSVQVLHADPDRAQASELSAGRLLKGADFRPRPQPCPPQRVLLTGASGFLGRSLTRELLNQLGPEATLYCLVRAPSHQQAEQRWQGLWQSLPDGASLLEDARLRVVAGDLAASGLGLTAAAREEIVACADTLVHNGALVNHLLDYADLVGPNLGGTVEIARLALEGPAKALHFVSTAALRGSLEPQRALRDPTYAWGYTTSKWAAEAFLEDFQEKSGLPLTLYRCPHLLPHSRLPQEYNPQDMWVLLMQAILREGCLPDRLDSQAYPGLCVDQAARALVGQMQTVGGGLRRQNLPANGPSLDSMLDWMEQSLRLPRVPSRQFFERLQASPHPASVLLLQRWGQSRPARKTSRSSQAQEPSRETFESWLRALGTAPS